MTLWAPPEHLLVGPLVGPGTRALSRHNLHATRGPGALVRRTACLLGHSCHILLRWRKMKAFRAHRRARLPEPLAPLQELAFNLRWSWDERTRDLFRW